MRLAVAVAISCISISSLSAAEHAVAAISQTDIPPESLGAALETLARDRKLQLIYATDDVGNRQSDGAVGNLSTGEALRLILKGTGLSYRFLDEKTVTVQPAAGSHRESDLSQLQSDVRDPTWTKVSLAESLRLAQANQGTSLVASAPSRDALASSANSESSDRLEEVVVTAQKREERLTDVPVPVTVVNVGSLIQNNQVQLSDYYTSIPGLSLTESTLGTPILSIRGISGGDNVFVNPTVSILVDDIPYSASTALSAGPVAPDVDPSDLARIEVLRGPQGTLYGASTIGGAIKYVTIDPAFDSFSGRVQAGLNGVVNGPNLGYDVRGAGNMPLSDAWAVRVSGFYRILPGFIDNLNDNARGVNRQQAYGGRVAALWKVSDTVSLKLSASVQHSHSDGFDGASPGPGITGLYQQEPPNIEAQDRTYQVYSATLNAKWGTADFVSISSYSLNQRSDAHDITFLNGFFTPPGVATSDTVLNDVSKTSKITQEFRLDLPLGRYFDWLVGAYFTHENTPYLQQFLVASPTTGEVYSSVINFHWNDLFTEYAAFTDLTVHFTDRFSIQLGGRESEEHQSYYEVDSGLTEVFDGQPSPYNYGGGAYSKDNAFTYLVTPKFNISENVMAYSRIASGFRAGGPNGGVPPVQKAPEAYGPDKTQNYELGIKGDLFHHTFSFDASIYDIAWKNIQLQEDTLQGSTFVVNASEARSEGAELSLQAVPLRGLTLGGWVAYNKATITSAFPIGGVAYAEPGDRLPYSPKISGRVFSEYEFPLVATYRGFVGPSVSYVGDRDADFTGSAMAVRTSLPGYARLDLHMGVRNSQWLLNVYANNLTDRRGLLTANVIGAEFVTTIRPREIGLSIARDF